MLVYVVFLALLVSSTVSQKDFLLYLPTHVSSNYQNVIRNDLRMNFDTVDAIRFRGMTVSDFQKYRSIVFADPYCTLGPGFLPTANLDTLYRAANGNVVLIGTDEYFHWGQGGRTLATSALRYSAAASGKTGLYISFSCYYAGAAPQTVPFLAPLSSTVSFQTQGSPGCFNNAHIVATSPAIAGLTDASLSNWSCSVHEVFTSFPPNFIPLVIARGIGGTGSRTFADGSFGIPYIMVRGEDVSPVNCGDGRPQSPEECDSGSGCTNKCVCSTGFTAFSPIQKDCRALDMCAIYGFSGKPENTLKCENGVNQRTITCKDNFYPASSGMNSKSITLIGNAPFLGCSPVNLCTLYGYSGKPANALDCSSSPDGTTRTITCVSGYYAQGSSPATSGSVTLRGATAFDGCTLIDNCLQYGYSGRPANAVSCVNSVNQRTITCADGYFAVAPATISVVLTGSTAFQGCNPVDMCKVYGYNGDGNVVGCENVAVNKRKITCRTGYWAMSDFKSWSSADNNTQYTTAAPSITLTGTAPFQGCALIGNCKLYGYSGKGDNTLSCTDGVGIRTITCAAGYYAVAPATASVTLSGSAAFGGCTPIDMCKVYGSGNGISCTNGINTRTITCAAGFYAVGPTTPTITITGAAPFGGCFQIDNCRIYGYGNAASCTNGVDSRTITCGAGYYAIAPATPTITLSGSTPFGGCKDIDECALYGFSDKGFKVIGCSQPAINTRTITCDAGYAALPSSSSASVTLTGSAPFAGCVDIDECAVYGSSGKPAAVTGCANNGVNQRTLTCDTGYYAIAPDVRSITLIGSATFAGCKEINECSLFGYSGRSAFTVGCTDELNKRTITCAAGYYAVAPDQRAVTLVGPAEFPGCTLIDNCALYGYSGKKDNTISCVNGVNTRTITCAPGYFAAAPDSAAITLVGSAGFAGCAVIDMCKVYGYSGKSAYTTSCSNNGINQRTISCATGYYPVGSVGSSRSILLTGPIPFAGCEETNQCNVYGYSGKPEGTLSCVSAVAKRTITCAPGYYAVAPTTPTIVLGDAETFNGCTDINECDLYGYTGRPSNAVSCKNEINQRTITCAAGYYAVAPATPTVTLVGSAGFNGCTEINECTVYGYSGKPENTLSCTEGLDQRTITCKPGYWSVAPDVPTVTLKGSAPFVGCTDIDECAIYGFNGLSANTVSCSQAGLVNQRRITCAVGYYAVAPTTDSITLTAAAKFEGCKLIDTCATYGFGSFATCVSAVNSRTITCAPGYYATAPTSPEITIIGATAFAGCKDISECTAYKCTDVRSSQATTCSEAGVPINNRVCTCPTGWQTVQNRPSPSVTLTGSSTFDGCVEICGDGLKVGKEECDDGNRDNNDGCSTSCTIEPGYVCPKVASPCNTVCGDGLVRGLEKCDDKNTISGDGCSSSCQIEAGWMCLVAGSPCMVADACLIYAFSGKPDNTLSCVNGQLPAIKRVITCLPGYYAVAPDQRTITLVNDAKFMGCFDIDECSVYGYSGKPDNAISCVHGENTRTITCATGYAAQPPSSATKTIVGDIAFDGCKLIDNCYAYGDNLKPQYVLSCTNIAFNTRRITCQPGYAPSGTTGDVEYIDLVGATVFGGCVGVDQCTVRGFSGKPENTLRCEGGINQRTLTCQPGYYAEAPDKPSITLTGAALFQGCKDIDECAVYGWNKDANVSSCQNLVNQRKITCKPGYFAVSPDEPSITLWGKDAFTGCKVIDLCATYGSSGKSNHVIKCEQPAVNVRTLTCDAGYYAKGPASASADFVGDATFAGCKDINECEVYGYSDLPANTESCSNEINRRIIKCKPGFFVFPANSTVTLVGDAKFTGCSLFCGDSIVSSFETCDDGNSKDGDGCSSTCQIEKGWTCSNPGKPCDDIDECAKYGFSSNTENTETCLNQLNQRTIVCKPGYAAAKPDLQSVALVADAPFQGCTLIDNCGLYGVNNKQNTAGCKNGINTRTVTCQDGYDAIGSKPAGPSVTLTGNAAFQGCEVAQLCTSYPSGPNSNCSLVGINVRQITCDLGFYAVPPAQSTVQLVGRVDFGGCKKIDMCNVYTFPNQYVESCTTPVPNQRLITCQPGFYAAPPDSRSVTLTGKVTFTGCHNIPECALYGYNNKSDVLACTEERPNTRTITCQRGYRALPDQTSRFAVLTGKEAFQGCVPIPPGCGNARLEQSLGETCDDGNAESGDGCSKDCTIEEGYVCDIPGDRCCSDLKGLSVSALVCVDGWWTTPGTPGGIITLGTSGVNNFYRIPDSTKMCGTVRIVDAYKNNAQVVVDSSTWYVDGSVDLQDATLAFRDGGNLVITETNRCGMAQLKRAEQNETYAFSMTPESSLQLIDMDWSDPEQSPPPLVSTEGCANLDGEFFMNATSVPNGSNQLTIVNASCTRGAMAVKHDIPGTCSDALFEEQNEDTPVAVTVNRKHLCHSSIIAMSLILFCAFLLLVILVVWRLTKKPSADEQGYYQL